MRSTIKGLISTSFAAKGFKRLVQLGNAGAGDLIPESLPVLEVEAFGRIGLLTGEFGRAPSPLQETCFFPDRFSTWSPSYPINAGESVIALLVYIPS